MALTRGVTLKSVTLALILIPINCYWIMYTEMVWWGLFPTTMSLFFNAVFFLFIITLLNLLLRRVKQQWALTHGRAARHLCDALYGECYRITRSRAGAYPDDWTRLLV